MSINPIQLLRRLSGQENTYTIPKLYVQLLGSQTQALILNQIIFYSDKSSALKDGWFYKSYDEWSEETSISTRTVKRIMKNLCDKGYIDRTSRKIRGVRTACFRPNLELIMEDLSCLINDPKCQNGARAKVPKWHDEAPNTIYTEDTSEEMPIPPPVEAAPSSKELGELIAVWNDLAVKAGCPVMGQNKRDIKDLQRYIKAIKENWKENLTMDSFAWLLTYAIESKHFLLSKFQHKMPIIMRWNNFENIYIHVTKHLGEKN